MRRRTRNGLLGGCVVLVLAAVVDLHGIADLPFYTRGEPREAVVVAEMARGGGLVLPMRNGTEIPSKPPLFHWLGLLASLVTGSVTELSTRLPSAVLAIAATVAVYAFGACVGRLRSGWLAATALLFSFEWLRAARTSRVDMTLAFFVTGALLCFPLIERRGPTRFRLVVFYACLALATLAKGPVGFVLPLLVIVVHAALGPDAEARLGQTGDLERKDATLAAERPTRRLLLVQRARRVIQTMAELRLVRGLSWVLLVTAAWYCAAAWIGGRAFLETHVLRENLLRVTDAERLGSGHEHGALYLLGQLFLGAFPASLLVPAVGWWLWRDRPLDPTRRYLVVWFLVIVIFFLIPESKRGVYLLPAYPAGALLVGLVLGPGPEGEGPRRLAALGLTIAAAALGLLGLLGAVVASGLPAEKLILPLLRERDAAATLQAVDALRGGSFATLTASALVLAGAALTAREAHGAHWLRASVPFSIAMLAALGGLVAPAERALASGRTFKPFIEQAVARVGAAPLAFHRSTFDWGVVFYADRRIPRVDDGEATEPTWVLAWEASDLARASEREVALRSSGTGPKGRSRLVLLPPERSRPGTP